MISRRKALIAGGVGVAAVGAGVGAAAIANRPKPEPPAPPSTKDGKLLWRNWSGIQHAYPQTRLAPANEAELATALPAAAAPIRPVGAGHSFTGLVPTAGTLVSIDA
ncbi:MAG TPA: oxidoreductase, partial [Caulobacteraceae bacterium]